MASPARASLRISAEDRRRQILDVATVLFARQGFEGTTTRQVAERAGVNEALIFRHFRSKEDLYWAIIVDKCKRAQTQQILRQKLLNGLDVQEVFASIAADILRRNFGDPSMSRLLLFSALENHKLSHRFFRTRIAETYELLADYIRKRVNEGVFRKTDPLLAARGFLGMVVYHFLIQELFGGKRYQKFDFERVGHAFADIWLHGMLPPQKDMPSQLHAHNSNHGGSRGNGRSRL